MAAVSQINKATIKINTLYTVQNFLLYLCLISLERMAKYLMCFEITLDNWRIKPS